MDNSAIVVIRNIWDIWRYNWLAASIRETLADREQETREEFLCRKYLKVKVKIFTSKGGLCLIAFLTLNISIDNWVHYLNSKCISVMQDLLFKCLTNILKAEQASSIVHTLLFNSTFVKMCLPGSVKVWKQILCLILMLLKPTPPRF